MRALMLTEQLDLLFVEPEPEPIYITTCAGGRWYVGHRLPGVSAIGLDVDCGIHRGDAEAVARRMNQQRIKETQ